MVVIWGLDLREMQWGKFKSSYMWNNEYHLRRTKFIIYQCAMIFTVVSESLGTAALSDYLDEQNYVEYHYPQASIYNDDFVGIFSYNIFVGVYVATIFGSAFFFDLFWPERHESPGVKLAWRICSVLAILFTLSAALGCTIILATHRAKITGPNAQQAILHFEEVQPHEPLIYKHNGRGIASVCFVWPGFVATVASTFLLWHSLSHIDTYGPFSAHARREQRKGFGFARNQTNSTTTPAGEKSSAPASRPSTAQRAAANAAAPASADADVNAAPTAPPSARTQPERYSGTGSNSDALPRSSRGGREV